MRIGIDARFFGPIGKGLGRYTQKLVERLEKIDKVNTYFIFLRKDNFADYDPSNPNFKKVLADFGWYTFSEQLFLTRTLNRYKLDLVHFPHFNVPLLYFRPFVVTIHDLILIHFPTVKSSTLNPLYYWIKFWAYRLAIRSALKRSKKILSVSYFTKNDILKKYSGLPEEKIAVTYEASEDYCMLSPNKDAEILESCGIMKPYVIYVGNAYPHKNLERLVEAFSLIQDKNLKMVIVGKEDYFYSRLKKFIREKAIKNIVFVGYVSDYKLDTLLHNSLAFIFPSLYEGFGLPPLEAMSKGIPVASSDHPCMREILGDSAHYFNGMDVNDIARSIEKITGDDDLRKKVISSGYRQVQKYSWRRMAEETLLIYREVLEQDGVSKAA